MSSVEGSVEGQGEGQGEDGTGAERHVPVLLDRVLELLAPALDESAGPAVVVDATLGLGGHAEALLRRHSRLRLVGLDRDRDALALSRARLAAFADRVELVHAVYDEVPEVLDRLELPAVQGFLFDLGVSSMQLDEAERGFAYAHDAPLDMRMDRTAARTAQDIIDTYSVAELRRILSSYGEERFAGRVAAAIVRRRDQADRLGPLSSSAELAELVRSAIPAATRTTGGHPAKRTFQALRIEVNGELDVLGRALPAALSRLAVRGRIVVMSYHSLEDRISKRALAALAEDTTPPDLPVPLAERAPQLRLLTRGAERADLAEREANPRSASVRLRAAERIKAAA